MVECSRPRPGSPHVGKVLPVSYTGTAAAELPSSLARENIELHFRLAHYAKPFLPLAKDGFEALEFSRENHQL